MEAFKNQFKISGNNNIQVGKNLLINPVFNVVNVSYSDIKTFQKVLKSVSPEDFVEEVLVPFMEVHPGIEVNKLLYSLKSEIEK